MATVIQEDYSGVEDYDPDFILEDHDAVRVARHTAAAAEWELISRKEDATAARQRELVATVDTEYKGQHVPDELFAKRNASLDRSFTHAERADKARANAAAERSLISHVQERPVYGPGSGFSYYMDLLTREDPTTSNADHGAVSAARQRLARYADSIRNETRTQKVLSRTLNRPNTEERGREMRAMDETSASGGAFVTPIYITESYGLFNSYPDAVRHQCTPVNDPGYGLELEIPSFDVAPASVAQQVVDNSGTASSTNGAGYSTAPIVTMVGTIPASYQLVDRTGPTQFDVVFGAALNDALKAATDSYITNQLYLAGGNITGAATFTAATFFQDIANAQQAVTTGAAVKLPATHAILTPENVAWLLSQSDPNGRPLALAHVNSAPLSVRKNPDGSPAVGYSGYDILGSAIFADGNLPAVTGHPTYSPIVLANLSEVFVLVTDPVVRVVTSAQSATSLTSELQMWQYVSVILRHSAAYQTLSSSAYIQNPVFS